MSHFYDFVIFVNFHRVLLEKLIVAVCVLVVEANLYSFQLHQEYLMNKGNLVFDELLIKLEILHLDPIEVLH